MSHSRLLVMAVAAVMALALLPGSASAAHLGNSQADINGTADPDATGQATVNYSDGTGLFNGTINVANLTAGESYTFLVRRASGTEVPICSDTATSQGRFNCSGNKVDVPAPGFTTAVVRNSLGMEVATGAFTERRGNCREPDQAGSQCTAPGRV